MKVALTAKERATDHIWTRSAPGRMSLFLSETRIYFAAENTAGTHRTQFQWPHVVLLQITSYLQTYGNSLNGRREKKPLDGDVILI